MLKLQEGVHFMASKWYSEVDGKDFTNYECTKCQFSSIYPAKIQDHWDKSNQHQHAWAFPQPSLEPEVSKAPSGPIY